MNNITSQSFDLEIYTEKRRWWDLLGLFRNPLFYSTGYYTEEAAYDAGKTFLESCNYTESDFIIVVS